MAALSLFTVFYVCAIVISQVFTVFNFGPVLLLSGGDVYVVSSVCVHVMSFTVLRRDCHRVLMFIIFSVLFQYS